MPAEKRRLLGLAFAAADLLIEIDDGGAVSLAVGGTRALLGRDELSLKGHDWRSLIKPEDQPLVAALHQDLEQGQRRGPVLVRLERAGGVCFAELTVRRPPAGPGLAAWSLLAAPAGRMPPADGLDAQEAFEDLTRSLIHASRVTGLDLEIAMIELKGLLAAASSLAPRAAQAVTASLAGALRAESQRGQAVAQLTQERFAVLRRRGEAVGPMADRISRGLEETLGDAAPTVAVHGLALDHAAPSAKTMRAIRMALDGFARQGLTDGAPESLADAMNRSVRDTLARAGALGEAVARRKFTLAYQPVAQLSDRSIHHHEVLVRFEDGGSPFAQIRMAEEFDIIEELDHAILEQSVMRMMAPGSASLKLAVNLSGRSVVSETYVAHAGRLLAENPSAKGRLIFEVTESSEIEDLPLADRHIQALRRMGSLVCLDDFGAGAASMAYLQQLHPDIVKIDGRYVRELADNGRDAALVRHVVKLCADLKVRTVAEMVETREVEAVVRGAGVDYAQGWLYGRPAEQPVGGNPAAGLRRRA